MNWVKAALGIGANLGRKRSSIKQGIELLAGDPRVRLQAVSHLYETPAWGVEEQPSFFNAAVVINTALTPQQLLSLCLQTETKLGRVRKVHWGSRTLDIDILFYGDKIINEADLTIPHPWLPQRLFVLVPLTEIAANWCHPVSGDTVEELLQKLRCEQEDIFAEIKQVGMLDY